MLLALVALLAMALPAKATSRRDPWSVLGLKPGMRMVIVDLDGGTHEGRYVDSPAKALVFDSTDGRAEMDVSYIAVVRAARSSAVLETVFATWGNLSRLPAKSHVRVSMLRGGTVEGQFDKVSEQALVLIDAGKAVTLPRTDILRVALVTKGVEEAVFLLPRD
ncbi:MAG: hypothetical protein JNK87_35985 [Bryobacterales bacterium]|nr:hypothetical protein [Bryobacterales bacterium]